MYTQSKNKNGTKTPNCHTPTDGTAFNKIRLTVNATNNHFIFDVKSENLPNSGMQRTSDTQKSRRSGVSAELDEKTIKNLSQTLTFQFGIVLATDSHNESVFKRSFRSINKKTLRTKATKQEINGTAKIWNLN